MGDWVIGKDWMSKMGSIGEKTLGPLAIYGGHHAEQSQKNRDLFKKEDGWADLSQAHASAYSALVNFLSRVAGKPIPKEGADAQGQITLIAHFVQGIALVETAIVEGLSILKQRHCCANSMRLSPQSRNTPQGAGRMPRHHMPL